MSVLRISADGKRKPATQRGKGARRLQAVGPDAWRRCENTRDNRADRTLYDGERSKQEFPAPRLRAVPTAATPDDGKSDDGKAQPAGRLVPLRDRRSSRISPRPRCVYPKTTPAADESVASGAFGVRALRAAFAALACAAMIVMGLVVGSLLLPAERQTVVVQSGDTLWAIAARIDGAPSTPKAVTDIAQLNSLGSRDVKPGQKLVLPRYR